MRRLATCAVSPVLAAVALVAACASSPTAAPGPERGTVAPTAGATAPPGPPPGLRLPTDVRPTGERISLRLDPAARTFTGTVRIQLAVSSAVPAFWLHAQDLAIRRATLVQGGSEQPVRTAVAPPDLLAIVPAAPLAPGAWLARRTTPGGPRR